MTSSNGNSFRVTGSVWGEPTVTWPVMPSLDAFFDLRLNKRLSKHSRRWWCKKPSPSIWCHCKKILEAVPSTLAGIRLYISQYIFISRWRRFKMQTIKCVAVGDKAVGKNSLFKSYILYVFNKPSPEYFMSVSTNKNKHSQAQWVFMLTSSNGPHKGQWRGALMFSLIFAWINAWVNNGGAGDWRRHRAHYDIIVMRFN